MSVISELRLTVSRTLNLGNYENVKIEVGAVVGKDSDDDTPEKMRDRLLDEVGQLVEEAIKDHVPKRRSRINED